MFSLLPAVMSEKQSPCFVLHGYVCSNVSHERAVGGGERGQGKENPRNKVAVTLSNKR